MHMKKLAVLFSVFVLLFGAGAAFAFHGPMTLLNTTWTGDVTILATDGSTSTVTGASLAFLTEDDDFLSGTITGLAAAPIAFSAIREGKSILITAVNYRITAEVKKFSHRHGHSKRPATLEIQGSNFADGSMLEGTLTLQPAATKK
jgi:hypothetical protein